MPLYPSLPPYSVILFPTSHTLLQEQLVQDATFPPTGTPTPLSILIFPSISTQRFTPNDNRPPPPPPILVGPSSRRSQDTIPDPLAAEIPRHIPWPPATVGQHWTDIAQAIANLQLTTEQMSLLWKAKFCMYPDRPPDHITMHSEARAAHRLLTKVLKAERLSATDLRAKFVLIHYSALPELQGLPELHERTKDLHVTFLTYGWSKQLPPRKGIGLRDIFPKGVCCPQLQEALIRAHRGSLAIGGVNHVQFTGGSHPSGSCQEDSRSLRRQPILDHRDLTFCSRVGLAFGDLERVQSWWDVQPSLRVSSPFSLQSLVGTDFPSLPLALQSSN